jgi:transcriptional regulator with XRE-family HTH domain
MKLGDVLRKERELRGISIANAAARLDLTETAYAQLEGGRSPAEKWGPLLGKIAIELSTPTSRLLSESGRSDDAARGACGMRIRSHRERRQVTTADVARALEMSEEDYARIERGESPIEEFGPLLLRFSELIDLPVFNLFYPCGLPLEKLDDYP